MSDNDPESTRVIGAIPKARSSIPPPPATVVLPAGTRLSDEFEIVGLVGQGGFGIVYLVDDHALQRRVAVKEYMPASLAMRSPEGRVVPKSGHDAETFGVGLRSFVNEARLLARFDHPALLKVYRFWEANGTAYMAMPYYQGRTLKQWFGPGSSPPDEAWMRRVLLPVMDALALLHSENCFHRDVAPDNIMLLEGERPVLLDFGAARRVIGDMTQALTVILKPGYAPIEQYAEMPGVKQGAWTDVYALAAVIHWMITGHTPPPAVGRMLSDSYEPLLRLAGERYSERFLRGIDRCLSVRGEERPQTMEAMRELLGWNLSAPAAIDPRMAIPSMPTVLSASDSVTPASTQDLTAASTPRQVDAPLAQGSKRPLLLTGLAVLLLVVTAAAWWIFSKPQPAPPPAPVAALPAPAVEPAPEPQHTVLPPPAPRVTPIALSISTPSGSRRFGQGQPVSIRVQPGQQAFVYCFMRDAKGELMRFFPNRFQPSAVVDPAGIELPGKLKFRINADFKGQPEWIACAASPVGLDQHPLLASGDFVALAAAGVDELRAQLAALAGPQMGWSLLELQKR
ncbi:MAG: hypothetical protein RLZZ555_946 [Pseudomonadota bacterium]